jgi:hypothetical protein
MPEGGHFIPTSWSVPIVRAVLRDYQPMLMQELGIDVDTLSDEEIVRLYRDLFGFSADA